MSLRPMVMLPAESDAGGQRDDEGTAAFATAIRTVNLYRD